MIKDLPVKYHATYGHDALPDPSSVGTRVYWVVDNEARYGVITDVQHKHVVVKLERRWNHKIKVALHWQMVHIASDQQPKVLPVKGQTDPARIERLRHSVMEVALKAPAHLTHYNELDAAQLIETAHSTSKTIRDYVESIEVMRITVGRLAEDLDKQIDNAVAYGVDVGRLPSRPSIESKSRRRKNDDEKRKLLHIRNHTRNLLIALLLAAEPDGATSEEVVATLCGLPSAGLPVTQHRVMGMLSAFSRRGEARLLPPNKWMATDKLRNTIEEL